MVFLKFLLSLTVAMEFSTSSSQFESLTTATCQAITTPLKPGGQSIDRVQTIPVQLEVVGGINPIDNDEGD